MSIEFKEGAVCYAGGAIWGAHNDFGGAIYYSDFQLNEPKNGYYIPKSELDTEEKYNKAVGVFGLFGYEWKPHASRQFKGPTGLNLLIKRLGIVQACEEHKELSVRITFDQLIAIGELKRKMNKQGSVSKVNRDIERAVKSTINAELGKPLNVSSNKYKREIIDRQGNAAIVDVYDVLKAFEVTCPATQHAVKKLLCSGIRGLKDLETDLVEAKDSITRAIELNG